MRYGSVCSGIEAATAAWHSLGWTPEFFSEIEPFPCAVLAHHYPHVPNHGDMTKFEEWPDAALDLLVGGTPCQSFSVAGLRKGLDDPRGNLMLTFGAIARRYRPTWLVWENVPGVLSSNGGRDFGTFLGMLGELGYGFAYRVLDAQFFGVAQRRRRVFVVGCLGDWRRAAAVLFERHSLSGHPAPSREARKVAPTIPSRSTGGGGLGTDFDLDGGLQLARCDTTGEGKRQDYETCTLVAHSLRGEGVDASEDGTGRGAPLVPVQPFTLAIRGRGDSHALEYRQDGTANALLTPNGGRGGIGVGAVAFAIQAGALRENPCSGPDGVGVQEGIAYTLEARAEVQAVADTLTSHWHHSNGAKAGNNAGMINPVIQQTAVRRLTPRECERLQGFPDDFTLIHLHNKKPSDVIRFAADGPRYKALGNSMAVPVMHWIGRRIMQVAAIQGAEVAA